MYIARTLFFLLLLALASACNDGKAPAPASKQNKTPPVLVEVARVQKHSVANEWQRSGTLAYRHILRVHTREEGRIASLPWFEGDRVDAGDILVTLDNELLKAELKKAKATRSMATRRVSRLERLRKTKATSEEDLIEAQTELELAQTEVEILETRLSYTVIKAPFDGVITRRLNEPGDAVPRNHHLLTLADPQSLVVRVAAPGQLLADLDPKSSIEIQLDIPDSAPFTGELQRIFPTLDPQSRQGTIEIRLDSPPDTARAGQFVRVKLAGTAKERLMLPFTALRTDRQGEYVFVVENGQVVRKDIVSGTRFGDWLEVFEGLEAGDQVVKRGFANLKNNTLVTVSN
ncbi:efflux RND transporter periplasmic adaptor subunit [Thiolapillus sp.]